MKVEVAACLTGLANLADKSEEEKRQLTSRVLAVIKSTNQIGVDLLQQWMQRDAEFKESLLSLGLWLERLKQELEGGFLK